MSLLKDNQSSKFFFDKKTYYKRCFLKHIKIIPFWPSDPCASYDLFFINKTKLLVVFSLVETFKLASSTKQTKVRMIYSFSTGRSNLIGKKWLFHSNFVKFPSVF